jgi:excinuclease ABC subunit C
VHFYDMSDSPIKPAVKLAKDQDWNESPIMQEGLKGTELITALVKHLPNQPGVYRMMNGKGDVLYVGKARNLKKRVTSYAQGRAHSLFRSICIRWCCHTYAQLATSRLYAA